jgi:hypothetical protein
MNWMNNMKHLKYLKTISELKDSTYLSAADGLERNHPERAQRLRKFVDDKYMVDIDYIDPRPLLAMDGVYYVTSVQVDPSIDNNNLKTIQVCLESVNELCILAINNYIDEGNEYFGMLYDLKRTGFPYYAFRNSKTNKSMNSALSSEIMNILPSQVFYFSDRKSARAFIEIVESESGEKLLFSVNDIYKS